MLIKPSYECFLTQYPRFKKFKDSQEMDGLFTLLLKDENIQKMKEFSDSNNYSDNKSSCKSALSGCYEDIKAYADKNLKLKINENFVKQCVGMMIKCIITANEYKKMEKYIDRKSFNDGKYFKSAACYIQSDKV